MRRVLSMAVVAGLVFVALVGRSFEGRLSAQGDGGYRLVPNWPQLPAGMYFGLKDAPPPPAEREAQAAARRARGGSASSPQAAGGGRNAQAGGPARSEERRVGKECRTRGEPEQ